MPVAMNTPNNDAAMQAATNVHAPYVRHVTPRGGWFALAKLNLVLRLAVKRSYHYGFDVAHYRRQQVKLDARLAQADPAVRRTAVDCDGVPADWVDVPESRGGKVILYLHGGAWFLSYPTLHHNMVAKLCRLTGARALVVDYRLCPEHRFPAGIDDCWTAWRWLRAQGVKAQDIVIAGDSAGGNLTLALLHRIKAAGEPMPAGAVLMSPLVDFTLSSPSMLTNLPSDPMFTSERLIGLRHLYLDGEHMLHPDASPLYADFSGLPPLFFQSSASEALRDDTLRAAARAHAAGVAVEVELWQGMPHVFQIFPMLPQGRAAFASMAAFIARQPGWGGAADLATASASNGANDARQRAASN